MNFRFHCKQTSVPSVSSSGGAVAKTSAAKSYDVAVLGASHVDYMW